MSFGMNLLRGVLGVVVLLAIAYAFSRNRKSIPWKTVAVGLGLQFVFALIVIKTSWGRVVFQTIGEGFTALLGFTMDGAAFVFGESLTRSDGPVGFVFAFQILPTIIFFGSLTSVLYFLGLLQPIVRAFGMVMAKVMGLSGAESLSAAGNVFLGQTEAPLLVKPYVSKMTSSELMALMVGGMATLAGGVLASYIAILGGSDPVQQVEFARHLLSASIMNAPAALFVAKILVPETGTPLTRGNTPLSAEKNGKNVIESAATGASEGLSLALNVGAMLLAFLALIALLNAVLGWLGSPTLGALTLWNVNGLIESWSGGQFTTLSLEAVFGFLLAPIAWIMGVESGDTLLFGSLLGQKVAINEFVAYLNLSGMDGQMSERSIYIATYALSGFANFSSIAIQIGGIGGIAPDRRGEIAQLGLKAVLGGMLATCLSGTIAGILL